MNIFQINPMIISHMILSFSVFSFLFFYLLKNNSWNIYKYDTNIQKLILTSKNDFEHPKNKNRHFFFIIVFLDAIKVTSKN